MIDDVMETWSLLEIGGNMIRIFVLLLSLMVLSVPAFAMNIDAEVENQLGIPIDEKNLPTGWKVLECK